MQQTVQYQFVIFFLTFRGSPRTGQLVLLAGSVLDVISPDSSYEDTEVPTISENDKDTRTAVELDESLYLNSLALFYLKLQAITVLPASTLQNITEEFQQIHDIGQRHLISKLTEKLENLGICIAMLKKLYVGWQKLIC